MIYEAEFRSSPRGLLAVKKIQGVEDKWVSSSAESMPGKCLVAIFSQKLVPLERRISGLGGMQWEVSEEYRGIEA